MNEGPVDQEAVSNIINFLKCNVRRDDIPSINSELKKEFVFAKRKSKQRKRKNKKKKNQYLNREEKKSLGFYNIPRKSLKYDEMLHMNSIWNDYMGQILELNKAIPSNVSKGWESFTQAIYRADYHGSILKVTRSKCPSYVGKAGICILDTKNTFKILSKDDIVSTIPKKDCVFEMRLRDITLKLFGKQLCARPAERSTKKVKAQQHPDL